MRQLTKVDAGEARDILASLNDQDGRNIALFMVQQDLEATPINVVVINLIIASQKLEMSIQSLLDECVFTEGVGEIVANIIREVIEETKPELDNINAV